MEAIGGYFELELNKGKHYHENAIRLNTARNCLEYILRAKKYKKIYIPYYTCDVLLEPLELLNISYEFYHINELLEPVNDVVLKSDEAYLYTNYYGIKQEAVIYLAKLYKHQLIVDNAQAFFAAPMKGIDTFYSARKFFGVADGAYLYTNTTIEILEQDISSERMSHLLKRVDLGAEAGYNDFQNNDRALVGQPIKRMSKLTEAILSSIDYEKAKNQRIENFKYLDEPLMEKNKLNIKLSKGNFPLVYPFWTSKGLRAKLLENKIYVAKYWPNIYDCCEKDSLEVQLTDEVMHLPIDQRYTKVELDKILNIII